MSDEKPVVAGTTRTFKCKWCPWSKPAWYKNENGTLKNGGDALVEHCEDEHPGEVRRLRAALDERERGAL